MKHSEEAPINKYGIPTKHHLAVHKQDHPGDKESSNIDYVSRMPKSMKKFIRRGCSSKQPSKDEELSLHAGQPKARTRTSKWPEVHNTVFGELLLEQCKAGNINNSVLRKDCWPALVSALNRRLHTDYTKAAVITHFKNMKADFHAIHQLRTRSGWGWDDVLHLPVTSDGVWAKVLKENPKWGRFRRKPFPQYEIFSEICRDSYTLGTGVRSTLKHFKRAPTNEEQKQVFYDDFLVSNDDFLVSNDIQFIDEDTHKEVHAEPKEELIEIRMSRSKRSSEDITTQKRRTSRRKAEEDRLAKLDLLLTRQEENARKFNQIIMKLCPYTMGDCLTKLDQMETLTIEALLVVNDALTNCSDNKITFMQSEGKELCTWIEHLVQQHHRFKDFPVWKS